MTQGLAATAILLAALAVYRIARGTREYVRLWQARKRQVAENRSHFAEIERLGPALYFELTTKEPDSDIDE